jgi:hypothetical protein
MQWKKICAEEFRRLAENHLRWGLRFVGKGVFSNSKMSLKKAKDRRR